MVVRSFHRPAMYVLTLLGFVACGGAALAQGAASTAVPFLLISPNSRASAMGESGVAVANDVSALFWNPAGLGTQTGQELSLSHAAWLPQFAQSDLFLEYANYKMHIPSIDGTVGTALTFLNLGEFERRGEGNEYLGTFKSFELAWTLAYGTRIDEDLSLGVGLRLIYSSLSSVKVANEQGSGTATAVAGDVGVLYRPTKFTIGDFDLSDRFALGLSVTNMGPSLTYIDEAQSDPLPTALRFGFSTDLVKEEYNKLTLSADFTKLLISRTDKKADPFFTAITKSWDQRAVLNTFTMGAGLEYWYSDFLALRFGFFHEDPKQGNRRFLTFGAGVRYEIYGFDFSYISTDISSEKSPLADTLRFTLSVLWDRATTPPDDGTKTPVDDASN